MSRIISLHYATTSSYSHPKKERFLSLDLAKGFTVLFIPAIHVAMLYSNITVHQNFLGNVLRLIAEWPGAQLLMFVMGMSFSFSKKNYYQQLKRALLIFLSGYVLNAFKFLFLYWFHLLPNSFITDLHFSHPISTTLNLLLIGDILQFAGLSLAIMCLLKFCRYYAAICVLLVYMIVISSHLFWNLHHSNFITDQLLHLIGGNIDDAFFPLFPWLVFPLTGLAIGRYLQGPCSILPIFVSGVFLFVCGFAIQLLPFRFPDTLFWRTYPDKTIMHLGFVMVWSWLWLSVDSLLSGRLLRRLPKHTWASKLLAMTSKALCFSSRNITSIYIVQWILIFWMLPLWGYHNLDTGESLIAMSLIYIAVFGLVWFFRKKRPG